MGTSNKYWYDGTLYEGGISDNTGQAYWHDGTNLADTKVNEAQTITGSAGIASAETFGSGGTCLVEQQLSGNGIASAEAFGAGYIQPGIWGSAGIVSGETFGAAATDSGIVTGDIYRFTGIPSAEAFGVTGGRISVDQTLTRSSGIVSAEAFGSTGASVLNFGMIAGITGIPSDEAFGSGGVVAGPITGSTGIPSGEAFGITGAVLTNVLIGSVGIPSAEAFGANGIIGNITGTAGIPSAEAFGANGVLVYDQTLTGSGIASAEAFGANGFVDGPQDIVGSAGIASAEAFGTPGVVAQIFSSAGIPSDEAFGSGGAVAIVSLAITGSTGIASAEAFGSTGASVVHGLEGFFGIPSEEAFGFTGGAVMQFVASDPTVLLYWNGTPANDYLKINTLTVRTPSRGRGEASFTWYSETGTVRPELGDRIEMYYRSNPTDAASTPEILFSGAVESLSEKKLVKYQGATEVELQITCNDWNQILDRRLFTYVVPAGATCLTILQAMKAQILDAEDIGLSAGNPGITVPEKTYDHATCSEVLAELCEASGWDARVGYDRILYFGPNPLPTADWDAPYVISNTSQEFTEISVSKARNGNKYRNVQYMALSGADRSNKALDTFTATGNPDYTLSVALTRTPVVKVDGVEKIVTQRPTFSSGWQVSWEPNSATISFDPRSSLPTVGQSITVEYPSDVGDFVVVSDAVEIAARAAAEGGTGRYETKESFGGEGGDVDAMAQSVLDRYGEFAAYSAQVESNHWGWKAGQNINVSITRPYMSPGQYYIEEVTHTFEYRNFRDSAWTSDFRTSLRVVKNGRQGKGFRDAMKPGGGGIGGGGGFGGGGGGFTPGGSGWSPGTDSWTFNETSSTNANNGGVPQRYLFSLASSQPGCTNAGLVDGHQLPPQIVCFPGIIREVQAYLAVQAGDQNVIFDVRLNGVSLFGTVANQPQFPPTGSTPTYSATTFNNFVRRSISVRRGDLLQVIVQQTGSDDPDATGAQKGTDGQVIVVVV